MQYWQRRLHRSVTEMRRLRRGRSKRSTVNMEPGCIISLLRLDIIDHGMTRNYTNPRNYVDRLAPMSHHPGAERSLTLGAHRAPASRGGRERSGAQGCPRATEPGCGAEPHVKMNRHSWMLAVGMAASIVAAPLAQKSAPKSDAKIVSLKHEAAADVESRKDFAQQMVDQIFSYGELGFQEFETTRYLMDILKTNGFTVQEAVAGIPTAFIASWGSGKPVIALGSDIDCIPQASQKPGVAYHDPVIEGAPGHGEGHNSGQAVNITAALAVKKIMERDHLQGTLRIWTGTAEELVGTKAYYVRAGLFKDVDISIFAHVGENLSVTWGDGTQNGLVSVEYSFKGESAHAASAPWR